MDIQVISQTCAKIIITKQESEKLDISFENFEKECANEKTFLTYVISVLSKMGIINSPDDKISIEVFEQENRDLIIYISAYQIENSKTKKPSYYILPLSKPDELFRITDNYELVLNTVSDPELYFYSNCYYLIFKSQIPENKLKRIFKTETIYRNNHINIAKIKEYGTFLSNTPFEKLI